MKTAGMVTASAGVVLALVLAGCATGSGGGPVTPGVTTVVSTVTETEAAPPGGAGESTTQSRSDAPTPATSDTPPAEPSPPGAPPSEGHPPHLYTFFSGLRPVDVAAYLGSSPGPVPGARFTSPTGNITCHLTEIAAACRVAEHAPWPPAERANDGLPDAPPNVVGWVHSFGLTGRPTHWARQGTFPIDDVDLVLEYGHQLTMPRSLATMTSHVTCGSRVEAMTCIIDGGAHGFTVSRETYRTW